MRDVKDSVKLSSVTSNGEYLFCYSDKFNIYLFFKDISDKVIYKIVCDKYLLITQIDTINIPFDFMDMSEIVFFKPQSIRETYLKFVGVVTVNSETRKFEINNFDSLILLNETHPATTKLFNILSCLDDVNIISHVQLKNKLYIVAYDPFDKSNLYGVVDVELNKIVKYYVLLSDLGDIVTNSINLDISEDKVYIVGTIITYDDEDNISGYLPYLETFNIS